VIGVLIEISIELNLVELNFVKSNSTILQKFNYEKNTF
jgi:hypothetical protein